MMEDRHLYRGKRLDNKEWVYGFLFYMSYDGISGACIGAEPLSVNDYGEIHKDCYFEVDPSTVGQYTGLTDKNGALIWEGDVVKCEGKSYKVIWDDYGWNCDGFYNSGYDYPTQAFSEGTGGFEVIGNIHDQEGES